MSPLNICNISFCKGIVKYNIYIYNLYIWYKIIIQIDGMFLPLNEGSNWLSQRRSHHRLSIKIVCSFWYCVGYSYTKLWVARIAGWFVLVWSVCLTLRVVGIVNNIPQWSCKYSGVLCHNCSLMPWCALGETEEVLLTSGNKIHTRVQK